MPKNPAPMTSLSGRGLKICVFSGGVDSFAPITAPFYYENSTEAALRDSNRSLRMQSYAGKIVLVPNQSFGSTYTWVEKMAIPGGAIAVVRCRAIMELSVHQSKLIHRAY